VCAVTHDRYFLDNVAGWILELDRGQGIPFEGNYNQWLEAKGKRLEVAPPHTPCLHLHSCLNLSHADVSRACSGSQRHNFVLIWHPFSLFLNHRIRGCLSQADVSRACSGSQRHNFVLIWHPFSLFLNHRIRGCGQSVSVRSDANFQNLHAALNFLFAKH
jgi:hypothetical protein